MKKICSSCKETKEIKLFHKDKSSKDGYSHRCAKCSCASQKLPNIQASRRRSYLKNIQKYRDRSRDWEITLRGKYNRYKRKAKERKLSFLLSEKEFESFWEKPCFYCGSKIKTIGLDRVDNKTGYEIGNVKPCCELCNWMKRDMTQEEFHKRCEKIVNQWNPGKAAEYKDRKNYDINLHI